MRYETYQPKFHPRSIVFETKDEWELFVTYINQSDINKNSPTYNELNDFAWNLYNMISEGLEKI